MGEKYFSIKSLLLCTRINIFILRVNCIFLFEKKKNEIKLRRKYILGRMTMAACTIVHYSGIKTTML